MNISWEETAQRSAATGEEQQPDIPPFSGTFTLPSEVQDFPQTPKTNHHTLTCYSAFHTYWVFRATKEESFVKVLQEFHFHSESSDFQRGAAARTNQYLSIITYFCNGPTLSQHWYFIVGQFRGYWCPPRWDGAFGEQHFSAVRVRSQV